MAIRYVRGDATLPPRESPCVIAHICNDVGMWGAGFVVPLGKRYPAARAAYFGLPVYTLGEVHFVPVSSDGVTVANMIAQTGVRLARGVVPPVRYAAVEACLKKVAAFAIDAGAGVHMPRIGCGLAGGTWAEIEAIVSRTLVARGVTVTVYDL